LTAAVGEDLDWESFDGELEVTTGAGTGGFISLQPVIKPATHVVRAKNRASLMGVLRVDEDVLSIVELLEIETNP